jgi:hypothetical protein
MKFHPTAAVQERYKFPGFLRVPIPSLQSDGCVVITTLSSLFAPFHDDAPDEKDQSRLEILWICRQLLPVIIAAAPTLALRPTAHALLRTISGG